MSLDYHIYYLEGLRYDQMFTLLFSVRAIINSAIALIAYVVLNQIPNKVFKLLAKIPLFVSFFLFSSIPSILSAFYMTSVTSATILTYLLYLPLTFWYILSFIPKKKVKVDDEEEQKANVRDIPFVLKNNFIKIAPLLFISTFIPYILPRLTQDTCVTYYNLTPGGVSIDIETTLSTRFTRSFYLEEICPPGPPCHVYATLPEDSSSSVFINVHTSTSVKQISIFYDTKENYEQTDKLKQVEHEFWSQTFQDWDPVGKRNMFTFCLKGLKPETEYYYIIYYNGEAQYRGIYKTLPTKESDSPVTFVVGGDVASTKLAHQMTSMLEKYQPDVFVIGGDSAYDNALHSCWYCWDTFLNMFEEHSRKVNRTIPIVVAIGNHDAGFNANANTKVNMNKYPLYFYYLPQNSIFERDGDKISVIPELLQRRSYFYHLIGKVAFFSLDSKFLVNYTGQQGLWLEKHATQFKDYAKFAIYHVPMHPCAIRYDDNPKEVMDHARDSWGAIFEATRFVGAFENHNHGYKITKPLKQGKVDNEGVMYFGDGSWGVLTRHPTPDKLNRELFEDMGNQNHVFIMKTKGNELEIFPVDVTGEKLHESIFKKI